MYKFKKNLKTIILITIIILFLPLSYFKLFTLKFIYTGDSTKSIVKIDKIQLLKNFYTLDNSFSTLPEYKDSEITIIHSDENSDIEGILYFSLIICWWIILFYLITKIIKFSYLRFNNKLII